MPKTRPFHPEFDQEKFSELLLYIAQKSADDPRFGAVKLNKILFFSDFIAYRRLGKPITGATYQRLNEGPAPRQMMPTRRIMVSMRELDIELRPYFNGLQQRIVALRPAKLGVFSADELEIVDEVIAELWDMTARDVSDYSHRELGWILAKPGDVIPYETAWLSSDPLPQEAEEYGLSVAAKLQ